MPAVLLAVGTSSPPAPGRRATGPRTPARAPTARHSTARPPTIRPAAETAGPVTPTDGPAAVPYSPWAGRVVDHGRRDLPMVALTFDSNLTPFMETELDDHRVASFYNGAVIDELDALRVPATIFLAGLWMRRYPDATRRLAADPLFELGIHSYAHRPFSAPCYGLGPPLPPAAMAPDIEEAEATLRLLTGRTTPYFRFPGGCYDDRALAAIRPTGVVVVEYDLPSGDAFGTSTRAIVDEVLGGVHDGSIVVMHITGGNTAPLTATALPAIVSRLRTRGYSLVTVGTLLAAEAPPARIDRVPVRAR